jgi:hypothetical protein
VRDTAPHSGEHLYEVSLESLHTCRRYAPDKIGRRPPARPNARPPDRPPARGVPIIRPVFQTGV